MNFHLIVTGILLLAIQAKTSNYIGMQKEDIIKNMQKSNPGFDLDESSVNKKPGYFSCRIMTFVYIQN